MPGSDDSSLETSPIMQWCCKVDMTDGDKWEMQRQLDLSKRAKDLKLGAVADVDLLKQVQLGYLMTATAAGQIGMHANATEIENFLINKSDEIDERVQMVKLINMAGGRNHYVMHYFMHEKKITSVADLESQDKMDWTIKEVKMTGDDEISSTDVTKINLLGMVNYAKDAGISLLKYSENDHAKYLATLTKKEDEGPSLAAFGTPAQTEEQQRDGKKRGRVAK